LLRFAVGPGKPSGSEAFNVQVAVKRNLPGRRADTSRVSLLEAPWRVLVKLYFAMSE